MTAPTPDQAAAQIEREKFEAWFEADSVLEHSNWFRLDSDGDYEIACVQEAWRTWQAARRELLARQVPEWLPIETAPKETEVLGWREDCGAMLMMHTSYDRFATDRECDEIDEGTLFLKDWFGSGIPWGMVRLEGSEIPTHWMPLPADPTAAGAGEVSKP